MCSSRSGNSVWVYTSIRVYAKCVYISTFVQTHGAFVTRRSATDGHTYEIKEVKKEIADLSYLMRMGQVSPSCCLRAGLICSMAACHVCMCTSVYVYVCVCVCERACRSFARATQFNEDTGEGSSLDGPQGAPVTTALHVSFFDTYKAG